MSVAVVVGGIEDVAELGIGNTVGMGIEDCGFPETGVGWVGFKEQARDKSLESFAEDDVRKLNLVK